MKLNGKTALVTGGTSGIGEAIAERFAAEGAAVAVAGASDIAKARGVAERIAAQGGTAQPFVANVRDVASVNRLVEEVNGALGRIDILVNSAGVFYQTPIGETSEEDYDRTMDINVKGTFFLCNAVVPLMKAQGGGNIINLSSVLGVMAGNAFSVYSASKAAVNFMTRSLAIELAPHNIRVNAILPGNTATPMNEAIRSEADFKPLLDMMAERTPSNRTYSDPADMAAAALFLASDDSRAMHGGLMVLDEGFSLGM